MYDIDIQTKVSMLPESAKQEVFIQFQVQLVPVEVEQRLDDYCLARPGCGRGQVMENPRQAPCWMK